MAVEETTTESRSSSLGGSIKGVFVGGVLFIAGIPLLPVGLSPDIPDELTGLPPCTTPPLPGTPHPLTF